ncbi:5432_t:CDS:2, partial [Dentiscutata erythropus]
ELMISTYILCVIRARPNGFFKNKGVKFVDRHSSHVHDDVIKALNAEGLDIVEISGGTICVLQPPDISVNKGNCKKALYELVSEWVFQTWKEIDTNILTRSFEAAGLTLNLDSSEDDKMSSRIQAIITNHMDEVTFDKED